ncbi:MAG: MerR family transcriptional regulator [Desulfovibrio desulfuricans]|jgi:DNA-binding transcriptional MerR regulator|nr:MerR family transcriptional regulator [Desulfovibrio desulfuricans]
MARRAIVTEGLLSIADISRHFSLPESTTRYYCKRFSGFIPSVGEGRRRRYRPETLDVIAVILDQMQKSRTAAAVEDALHARFPQNALALAEATPATPAVDTRLGQQVLPAAALQLMERQTAALEGIAQLLHELVQRIPAPAPQGEALSSLRRDMDTLRILLDSAEKTQQADLNQLRAWMTKVIRERRETQPVR